MARVRGILLVFHLPEGSPPAHHRRFRRRLYGEETSSWAGRYRYRRRGLLDAIPHVLLYWGSVIVGEEDARRLVREIRREGGVLEARRVELTTKDTRRIGRIRRQA
jgi:hypothetical protein